MEKNIIPGLLREMEKEKINFVLARPVKNLTKELTLPKLTNELGYFKKVECPKPFFNSLEINVDDKNLEKVLRLIKEKGFLKVFSLENSSIHYLYNRKEGLLEININLSKKITRKKKLRKIGKKGFFICFVAPEGGGKTSSLSGAYMIFENFPVKKEYLTFSSFKESRLHRIADIKKKLLRILYSRIKGKLIFTDRYLYLTFRNRPFLRKLLWKIIPEPDIVFIMKAPYKVLKKRRGPLCKPEREVREIYSLFERAQNKIKINSQKKLEKNLEIIINSILRLYSNEHDKAK